MSENSKDAIKSRMIRNASGIWGYPDTQDINSFDPVVGMIIGALAEELYNLSGEIKRTDARVVEKLFELLISQDVFTHFPAYALAKAKPTQPRVNISESFQFSYLKKIQKTINEETVYDNKTINFTPTSDLILFKGDIKYLATGTQLFEISDQVKESIANTVPGSTPDFSRLHIGLKLDNMIDKIDGLSFMFSIKNKQNEERFFSLLSNAKWRINNKDIDFGQGLGPKNGKDKSLWEVFRGGSDICYKTCTFVNEFYRNRFMTVKDHNYHLKNLIQPESVPEELKRKFHPGILKALQKDIIWVEIQLSQQIAPEIINDLVILMNCFPVINRELIEFNQLLTKGINIIPLTSEDLFFDVKMVSDTKGTQYKAVNSFNNEDADEDGYLIRQGGISRFDSSDARETISHLIDLIRDERAGFALLGTDMISSDLKQLDQIVLRLKQRLEASDINPDANTFIMLNSNSNFERAFIQFWTTSGEIANNIRSNSRLTLQQGSDLDGNSVVLVTSTYGGRQKLSSEDKLNKLRRILLSKGRIVTREDIRALCFEHFGSDLLDVEIKKGVHLDPLPEKGLVRSLDIYLRLSKQNKSSEAELNQKCEELKIRLQQESVNILPYRILCSLT